MKDIRKLKPAIAGLTMSLTDSTSNTNIVTLTDANNKEFNIDINNLSHIVEDAENDNCNIQDNENPIINFEPSITDSEGKDINISDAISSINSGNGEIVAVDALIEVTHSGLNDNNFVYNSEDLEEGVTTWLTPFKKPLLKNHDLDSEPVGRVIDAYHGKSDIANDRDTLNVTFRVTDKDAMVKLLDKRYKTVSIGASAGKVKCNVCGKDILKDGAFKFCGHYKGEIYNGEKATWTASMFNFKECSIVNNPADKYAQIKNIKLVKKQDIDTPGVNDSDNEPDILDALDDAIKNSNVNDSVDNADNNETPENNNPDINDNNNPSNDEPDNQDGNNNEDITDTEYKEKYEKALSDLNDANTNIATLNDSVTEKDNEINTLNDSISEKNNKINSLNNELSVVRDELNKSKENFLSVSILYKQSLIDYIVSKKVANNLIDEKDIDSEKASLLIHSTKELKNINDELKIENSIKNTVKDTSIPTVTNPSLADNTNGNVIEDENEDELNVKDDKKKPITLKDIEEKYLEIL
ncbi:hypothetical protein U729_3069 (plasmid) [Clostridium baratii str. Sullivan]|uniref:Uncharacterized protein n=1 Tax=Clostridium baratii str. Sullivan TaxID=1415775 RepID=A0A0A7G0E7_9CLOT|nr:hypothetical protein [Clostridium baratii]AIY85339.1 hypothetical protein U729_3069 [Clostridium baratii str. Sullivan]